MYTYTVVHYAEDEGNYKHSTSDHNKELKYVQVVLKYLKVFNAYAINMYPSMRTLNIFY